MELTSDEAASEFCDQQHPFSPKSVKREGGKTICTISGLFECGDQEQLIDERCFLYTVDEVFSQAGSSCKKLSREYAYELHKVVNTFEQKWISTFFSFHPLMWIENKGNGDLIHLDVREVEGKILNNKEGRLVAGESESYVIVTRKGSFARFRAGYLSKMEKETRIPALCSRPARPKPEYLVQLASKYAEAGLFVRQYKDMYGESRPFTIVRALQSFIMETGDEAKPERLHKTCQAFKHGMAATPYDFQNPEDFKKLLREAQVNIVAVPGYTDRTKLTNLPACTKDLKFMEQRLKFDFDIVSPDGVIQKTASNKTFWKDGFPTRTCGDMPRVALAFTQDGMVDIPNIARLFVACSFGVPPRFDIGEQAKCARTAKFDNKTATCECVNKEMDIRVQSQLSPRKTDEAYKPGTICLDCTGVRDFAVAIIIDRSLGSTLHAMVFTYWKLKFPMSYFNAAVKAYIILGSGISYRPEPGKKYAKIPSWAARPTGLFTFWFWMSGGSASMHWYYHNPHEGTGKNIVDRAIESAINDLSKEQYENKMIVAVMMTEPDNKARAEEQAKRANAAKLDLLVVALRKVVQHYTIIDTNGTPLPFEPGIWHDSASYVTMQMARRYCIKKGDIGQDAVQEEKKA